MCLVSHNIHSENILYAWSLVKFTMKASCMLGVPLYLWSWLGAALEMRLPVAYYHPRSSRYLQSHLVDEECSLLQPSLAYSLVYSLQGLPLARVPVFGFKADVRPPRVRKIMLIELLQVLAQGRNIDKKSLGLENCFSNFMLSTLGNAWVNMAWGTLRLNLYV